MRTLRKRLIFIAILTLSLSVSGFILTPNVYGQEGLPGQSATDNSFTDAIKNAGSQGNTNQSFENALTASGAQGDPSKLFQDAVDNAPKDSCGTFDVGCQITDVAIPFIFGLILKLAGFVTGLAGVLLNKTVDLTVVHMSENIKNYPINETWSVIRDVANMGFIFVLLFAAIQTIVGMGKDNKKLIVSIVVAAVLMNFSLFVTKVVIDFSNVLAITFYDSIAPGALNSPDLLENGISNAMMEPLKLASIMQLGKNDLVSTGSIMTIGVMGSIFLLIAAFVFLAISLMFIIRFVVLIFVMILSPIAIVAVILPNLNSYAKKWKDAWLNQAFFAPVYFLLTWVVIKVFQNSPIATLGSPLSGIGTAVTETGGQLALASNISGPINTVLNFIIVIAFLITSLMIAKSMSSKSGAGFDKLTGWAMGAAGTVTLGGVGLVGRRTLGAVGSALGDNDKLKDRASQSGALGFLAKRTLLAGRATAGASFDLRGAGAAGVLGAGKAPQGGYTKMVKDAAKKDKEFEESLKPSDIKVFKANQDVEATKSREKKLREETEKKVGQELPKLPLLVELERKIKDAETILKNPASSLADKTAAQTNLDELKARAKPMQESYEKMRGTRVEEIVSSSGIQQKVQKAQERADKLVGVKAKDVSEREKEIGVSKTDIDKRVEKLEQLIQTNERTLATITDPAERNRTQELLKTEREELKVAKQQKEYLTERKSTADLRKEASIEKLSRPGFPSGGRNAFIGMVHKSALQAAAEMRKGKKPLKDQIKDILNEDEPKEGKPAEPPAENSKDGKEKSS